MNSYKIILIGAPRTGKTSFTSYHHKMDFSQDYKKSDRVKINYIHYKDNYYNLWDCPGDTKIKGEQYSNTDSVLVFIKGSPRMADMKELDRVLLHSPHCRIIFVTNRITKIKAIRGYPLITISCKDGTNMNKVFDITSI